MGKQQAAVAGIIVEWDDAKHRKLNVKDGPLNKAKKLKSAAGDDEFTPSRIVADLKLDLGDATAKFVNLDNVHIKIPYTGTEPIVGWWNGAKWVKFKQVAYANNFADATLPSPWPTDPAIGSYP
jgi:hypothetical protein